MFKGKFCPFYFPGYQLLFSVLMLGSCEYDLDGEYFKEIQVQEAPAVVVELASGQDTVSAWGDIRVKFISPVPAADLYTYTVLIDGTPIETGSQLPGEVFLRTTNFTDGYHRLTLELTVKTNTSSLADQLGAEAFQYSYDWTLFTDNAGLSAFAFDEIVFHEKEGSFVIEWPSFNHLKFEKYIVTKSLYGHGSGSYSVEITGSSVSSWTDTSFIGGTANYSLRILLKDGQTGYGEISHTGTAPILHKAAFTTPPAYELVWSASKYPTAFHSYSIIEETHYGESLVFESSDINDTTFRYPELGFGANVRFRLTTASNNFDGLNDKLILDTHAFYGKYTGFNLNYSSFSAANNSYYTKGISRTGLDEYTLYRIDASSLEVANELYNPVLGDFTISRNARHLYLASFHYFPSNSIMVADPATLSTIETIAVASLTGINKPATLLSASDNNLLAFFSPEDNTRSNGIYYVVDMSTRTVVYEKSFQNQNYPTFTLSPSGTSYLHRHNQALRLYNLERSDYLEINTACEYNPENPEQLLVVNDNKIDFVNTATYQVEKSLPITLNLQGISIDPLTGNVGGYIPGEKAHSRKYIIHSAQTGEIIKEMKVYGYKFRLRNNTLFDVTFNDGTPYIHLSL